MNKASEEGRRNTRTALFTLIKFTLYMVLLPMGTMYFSYHFALEAIFGPMGPGSKITWAGVFAVVAVQLVIVAYVLTAYFETKSSDKSA
eukprot:c1057_g1_i1.p1 GENE.c1057_g1_i1~~c1057_g1_i1.p1  ORF type:complete len:104 (-),score=20.48 c1057_g1_i1:24-290(-)